MARGSFYDGSIHSISSPYFKLPLAAANNQEDPPFRSTADGSSRSSFIYSPSSKAYPPRQNSLDAFISSSIPATHVCIPAMAESPERILHSAFTRMHAMDSNFDSHAGVPTEVDHIHTMSRNPSPKRAPPRKLFC